jgi:hypothetical protein
LHQREQQKGRLKIIAANSCNNIPYNIFAKGIILLERRGKARSHQFSAFNDEARTTNALTDD